MKVAVASEDGVNISHHFGRKSPCEFHFSGGPPHALS